MNYVAATPLPATTYYVAATPLPATKYVFCVQGDWHPNSPQWEERVLSRAGVPCYMLSPPSSVHALSDSVPGSGRKHRMRDGPL
jgi:hypothetical protein